MSGEGDLKSKLEILSPGFSTCADFLLSQTYTNKIAAEVQEDPWAIKQPTRKFKKYFTVGLHKAPQRTAPCLSMQLLCKRWQEIGLGCGNLEAFQAFHKHFQHIIHCILCNFSQIVASLLDYTSNCFSFLKLEQYESTQHNLIAKVKTGRGKKEEKNAL